MLQQVNSEERMKIAKQSIMDWQILKKVEQADEEITQTKNRLKRQQLAFQNNTKSLIEYIAHIKDNIALFTN